MENIKIFDGIDQKEIDFILSKCDTEIFFAGKEIIKQGDYSDGKGYIIKSGEVKVIVDGIEVATLGVGETFGEIALLSEGERTATIVAKTDIQTFVLTQDRLIDIINNHSNAVNKQIISRIEQNLSLLED